MSRNGSQVSEHTRATQTIPADRDTHDAIRRDADATGIRLYRQLAAYVRGWRLLTREQRMEAIMPAAAEPADDQNTQR